MFVPPDRHKVIEIIPSRKDGLIAPDVFYQVAQVMFLRKKIKVKTIVMRQKGFVGLFINERYALMNKFFAILEMMNVPVQINSWINSDHELIRKTFCEKPACCQWGLYNCTWALYKNQPAAMAS